MDPLLRVLAHVSIERAHSAGQGCALRNDVAGGACVNRADRHDDGFERICFARTYQLQAGDDLRGNDDGIDRRIGPRGMSAAAVHDDFEGVGGRHHGADARRELADRQARPIVHTVDLADGECLHHAVLHHEVAAAAAFFRRLENHRDSASKIAGFGQIFGRAEQHGGVAVVPAGVHEAGVLGGPGLAAGLRDWQRVHVGAQADDRPVAAAALDEGDDARAANAGLDPVAAEFLQLVSDEARGLEHVEQQFGRLMQMPPPACDFILQFTGSVQHGHGFLHWLWIKAKAICTRPYSSLRAKRSNPC